MSKRQRMTWAALDREAAAPPATPGYGVEDQDHPAHTQDDPDKDDYNIGGPSEFGEDVFPPPYGDSGSPATPGYGVEDQDHPAHAGQIGRQAHNVMSLVRRKSAKALVLAKATLGKNASWDAIENQAFDYMHGMSDEALEASVGRLSGDFLGMEDEFLGMEDEFFGMEDEFEGVPPDPMEERFAALEAELASLRAAARQNDPAGQTLGTSGRSESDAKAEEKAVSDKAARKEPFMAMFDAYDTDGDGFVTVDEWGGPRSMFASLDSDGDGIIARHEVLAGCEKLPPALRSNCEAKSDKGEKDSDKEASDDEDEDDEGSDKEASKVAFGHFADFDEDELEMLQAMQYDMDDMDGDEVMGCGNDVMAAKKSDDDEDDDEDEGEDEDDEMMAAKKASDDEDDEGDEGSDKEAGDASFFQAGFDPMGLSDGSPILTAEDDALLRQAFAIEASEDEGEGEGEDEGSDKEASLARLLKPQGKKASAGVKTIGAVPRNKKASGNSEMAELENLWGSAPNVDAAFGI